MKRRFVAGLAALWLGAIAPLFAADTPEKKVPAKQFKVGVTQPPMFTLVSALAYGSPVETVLVQRNDEGRWHIPDDIKVLIWSGKAVEPALEKQLAQSGQAAVALMDAAGLYQLGKRTPENWTNAGDADIDAWGQGYGEVQMTRPQGAIDSIYWLDPVNAMAGLDAVTMIFQGLDQRNHWGYQANADQIIQALWELDTRVSRLLQEISDQTFVVLQDEFQYLETRYKLKTVPAAGSAGDIVDRAEAVDAKCVVASEALDPALETLLDQAGLNSVVLDPAGERMPVTTGAYFQWFGDMVSGLNRCMKRQEM